MTKTRSLQQAVPDAGPDSAIEQQLLALQAENQKLRKINQALIERVEAGQNAVHTGPYAAFQHAAVLAEQVRERTAELSRAYDELRRSVRYSETLAQSERWIRTITSCSSSNCNFNNCSNFNNRTAIACLGPVRPPPLQWCRSC